MKTLLHHISKLQSGLFAQPDIQPDTLYLQGVHFNEFGEFNRNVKPQLEGYKIERHLLSDEDILFAAKGLNNFAAVYTTDWGKAVASSSFIIVRLNVDYSQQILPHYLAWYLTYTPAIKLFHKQLGTTIPSISISKLKELEIEIPSLEHQRRIVEIQELRNREKQIVRQLEVQKDYLIKQSLLTAAKQ